MKIKHTLLALTLSLTGIAFAEDDHKGHEHGDHKEHTEHKHGEDCDHEKLELTAPNDGKIISDLKPLVELLVTEENKVQLTLLDEEGKAIKPDGQKFSAIAGERSNPTSLKFELADDVYVSTEALPEGKNIPVILTLKEEEKKQRAKFNLNLNDCPTCEFLEYACTCDHSEEEEKDDHEGHDH